MRVKRFTAYIIKFDRDADCKEITTKKYETFHINSDVSQICWNIYENSLIVQQLINN